MTRLTPQGARHKARRVGPLAGPWALCLLLCALALAATGCAKARAASAPDGPPLEVPEPPARVLGPLDDPLPAAAAAPDAPPPAPARAPARPPARRPAPAAAEAAPAEPAPAAPAAVTPPAEAAPAETRELRAAPNANTAAAERKVRDLLTRAARDVNRIDYARLSADGKAQYDQSKRFSQQAEQALRDRNYVFAETLADKAATLAAELLGR